MYVVVPRKCCLHMLVATKRCKDSELDLLVVRAEKYESIFWHECFPDISTDGIAYRNRLEVWSRKRQASCNRSSLADKSMNARISIRHALGKSNKVSVLELCNRPVPKHQRRHLSYPLVRFSLEKANENLFGCGHILCPPLGWKFRPHLNQHLCQLLRRSQVERSDAFDREDLLLEPLLLRSDLHVDGLQLSDIHANPRGFYTCQNWNKPHLHFLDPRQANLLNQFFSCPCRFDGQQCDSHTILLGVRLQQTLNVPRSCKLNLLCPISWTSRDPKGTRQCPGLQTRTEVEIFHHSQTNL
mmetsp:Transcript_14418/g.21022  ORF Transcript_14418/g.21022 Transcript_14418/m.21022 type:complete len:299 (+) Transcript_14418:2351-3247(+)